MDENVIVTTFSEDNRAYEAEIAGAEEAAHKVRVKARKELRDQRREATVEKVQAQLRELRERLRHLVHH